jgi:hypothetical protein
LYDTQRKAEKALDGYSLIIPNVDAAAIVDALLDAETEPA